MQTRNQLAEMEQRLNVALMMADEDVDCPKLPWIEKSRSKTASQDQYRLFFVCPATLQVADTNGGEGYDVFLPRPSLHALAPALLLTIHALRSRLGCGLAVGLPLLVHRPNRSPAAVRRAELSALDALERQLPPPQGPRMASQPLDTAPSSVYKTLRSMIESEDPGLSQCGLARTEAVDGTVAWVRPGMVAQSFAAEGKPALGRIEVIAVQLQA